MAFNVITAITLFITVLQLPSILAQKTTTTPSTLTPMTTTPGRIDPFITGKWGNRGSNAHMCGKSLDAIHQHVAGMLSKALEALSVLDFSVNLGTGTLTIKPPRVTEAGYARADYDLLPPKRIRSSFRDGRLVAKGVWQFKPVVGNLIGGTYIATVKDMELNATNQLGRTGDGKPIMQTIECKSHVGQYRIEIQGATDIKVVENCNWDVCHRVRKYFEDAICKLFDRFVKEVVNRELQSYPNKVTVYSELHKVDYSIMNNEPIVTDECIEFGMEGKYIWRGSSNVNFNPTAMQWVNRNRMLSFELSDYTFNTLLHQAHAQGHKFSAADLIETSPNFDQWLSLNNTGRVQGGSSKHRVQSKKTKGNKQEYAAPIEFLGQLFENFANFGPYSSNDTGDIVYKTTGQRGSWIFVQSDKLGHFDGSNGVLELYGPSGQGGNRQLLARVDIRVLRGEFTPKMEKTNITGSIKIIDFQLSEQPPHQRMITPEWLAKLTQFVQPILTEMFNDFFSKYAQFSIPLPEKYQCTSPQFSILARTMQVDCDIQNVKGGEDTRYATFL